MGISFHCIVFCSLILLMPLNPVYEIQHDKDCQKSASFVNESYREVIVKLKGYLSKESFVAALAACLKNLNYMLSIDRLDPLEGDIYKIKISREVDPLELVKKLERIPYIKWAEPNYVYRVQAVPNDEKFSLQWALHHIHAPDAWNITTGNPNITVAVIDTGVDYNHPDLNENIWINPGEIPSNGKDDDGDGYIDDVYGWDFTNNDNDPMDDNGHGTHCAGIIGAVGNNSLGICGLCWRCKIMPIKCFNSSGYATADDLYRGIKYAADKGADIISMSWGSPEPSNLIKDAIDYAHSKGAILVAAAGNFNSTKKVYPAAYNNVIAVAATDENDKKASFSEYGYWIDVCAPGVNIYSTLPSKKYGDGSGTSMACPFVAALAALVKSKYPSATQREIETIIESGVDRVYSKQYVGTGRINASKALRSPPVVAEIAEPHAGSVVRDDIIFINGTAEGNYTLSYGKGIYPSNWTIFYTSNHPVYNGTLARWNITGIDPGIYTLKLKVNCDDDSYMEDDVVVRVKSCMLHVGGSGPGNYTSIQDAIDDALDGDTIFVHEGTYSGDIVVDKNISLIGKNGTLIMGGFWGVLVLNSECVIKNLAFYNSSIGIYLVGARGNIENNTISRCTIGALLVSSHFVQFSNNEIKNANVGIEATDCSENIFSGNKLRSNGYGVLTESMEDMLGNCPANKAFNFETGFAENSSYTDFCWKKINESAILLIPLNGAILAILNQSYENVTTKDLSNVTVAASSIKCPSNKTILFLTREFSLVKMKVNFCDNTLNFTYSFLASNDTTENIFVSNYIIDNHYGMVLGSSFNNTIYNNCFSNYINAVSYGDNLWNASKREGTNIVSGPYLGGNYWSDYKGRDINRDGFGDTSLPYDSNGFIARGGDLLPLFAEAFNVNQGKWYYTLSTAFDNASNGDEIRTCLDFYEGPIRVSKGVRFIGSAKIDGRGGHGIEIKADNVYIENFTIFNASVGISMHDNSTVEKCHLYNCTYGIYGNSSSIKILNNLIEQNAHGISLKASGNFNISQNFFINNTYGIYIENSSYGEIYCNELTKNAIGVELNSSSNNILWRNIVKSNTYGFVLRSSSGNIIYDNYFNNTQNAMDDSNNTWNITKRRGTNIMKGFYVGGNFWSDYRGIDKNHDGFGDQPYKNGLSYSRDIYPIVISPSIVHVAPEEGAESVSVKAKIIVEFSKQMDTDSTEKNFHLKPSISGNFFWENGCRKMVFKPISDLRHGTKYTVTIGWNATDKQGSVLLKNFSWSFTTEKSLPPSSGGGGGWEGGGAAVPIVNHPPNPPSKPVGPTKGYTNISYTFSTFSTDPDGDTLVYIFDWGDGKSTRTKRLLSGKKVEAAHSWQKPGTYLIKVKAIDSKNLSSAWSEAATIKIEDLGTKKKPIAILNILSRALTNQNLTFDGSNSYDPDGVIVNYTWDFGDGYHGYGKITSHSYKIPGNYMVMLRVKDNDGLTNFSAKNIEILQDSDGDGWSDLDEEKYGTDPFNSSSLPKDSDSDSIPDPVDWDDDNDGLSDDMEIFLRSNKTTKNSYVISTIEGKTMYLVDVDGDSRFDTLFNPEKGIKCSILQSGKDYLIDMDGDGKADHVYDPLSGKVNPLERSKSKDILWIGTATLAAALSVLLIAVIFRGKRII